ncbi:MAG: hypothetical protein DPW09_24290 [Anaerolineae bacterium]|nr:hypothetical protein [Anaerolineae bacterium]
MSKRLIWLLTLLVTLALVAGCTGAATPEAEKPAATEEPAAEAPAATEEPAAEAPAATEEPAAEAPAATEEPAAEAPAAAGCTDAIGCVEIAAGDPIHIAWIATVSGGTAPLGTDNNRGVEIAIGDGVGRDSPVGHRQQPRRRNRH